MCLYLTWNYDRPKLFYTELCHAVALDILFAEDLDGGEEGPWFLHLDGSQDNSDDKRYIDGGRNCVQLFAQGGHFLDVTGDIWIYTTEFQLHEFNYLYGSWKSRFS